MRILLDARYLDGTYSGIGTYSRMLVEHLARVDTVNEYQVVIRPGFRENLEVGPNFEFLSYRPKPVSWQSYMRYHELLDAVQPDIVHCLSPSAPVFYDGPMMLTVHDLQPFIDPNFSARRPRAVRTAYNLFYKWAYPATIARAKWVICDSQATRDDIVRMMPGALPKLIVVPPGLEHRQTEPPSDGKIEAICKKCNIRGRYLLYYGSTRPNKNLPNLVRSFARLIREDEKNQLEDLSLVLVLKKDRFFRDIQKVLNNTKIESRVQILEQLEHDEKNALLAGAYAFTFPSKYEGFGFPPLEAMRAGVPVVAGRSGALPEVVGDAAVIVDPDDVDDITDGMREICTNFGLRDKLVEKGKVRAERFDWQETATMIRDIYQLLF